LKQQLDLLEVVVASLSVIRCSQLKKYGMRSVLVENSAQQLQ